MSVKRERAFFKCKVQYIMICFVSLQLRKALLGSKRLASLNKFTKIHTQKFPSISYVSGCGHESVLYQSVSEV